MGVHQGSHRLTPASEAVGAARGTRPRERLALALIVGLATIPFLNKPYHIDDVLYLRVAQQILETPWDPYRGWVLWDAPDGEPAPLWRTDFNPPLWKYLLAGVIAVAGRDEWTLHLFEGLAVAGAAVGLFHLGRRFTVRPLACTACIVLGPFFLPGQNLMLEAPLLCGVVWGVESLLRAWETGTRRWAWISGGCLLAAVLTKYTAGLVLPVLAVEGMRRRKATTIIALSVPVVGLGAWMIHNLAVRGELHFGAHGFALGSGALLPRMRTVLRCVGSVFVVSPMLVVALVQTGRSGWMGGGIAVLVALAVGWGDVAAIGAETAPQGWLPATDELAHAAIFTAHGGFLLSSLAWLVARRRWAAHRAVAASPESNTLGPDRNTTSLLGLWTLAALGFNVVSVPFCAIRHLLLALVPMTWLAWRESGDTTWANRGRTLSLGLSLVLGFSLAAADYDISSIYRRVAETKMRPAVAAGRQVWFTGTWGFAYYASQAGAFPLLQNPEAFGLPPIARGALVFEPMVLSWGNLERRRRLVPQAVAVDHVQPTSSNPFRTLAPNVNYYAVQSHSLPWRLSFRRTEERASAGWGIEFVPLDDILVYEVP